MICFSDLRYYYLLLRSIWVKKGYATASDCRTIIAKWYDFLEWLQNIGNSLDKSGGI